MPPRLARRPDRDASVDAPALAALVSELDLTALAAALERDLGVVLFLLVERDLVVARLELVVPLVVEVAHVVLGVALDDRRRPRLLGLHPSDLAGNRETGWQARIARHGGHLADRRECLAPRLLGGLLLIALTVPAAGGCGDPEGHGGKEQQQDLGERATHGMAEPI